MPGLTPVIFRRRPAIVAACCLALASWDLMAVLERDPRLAVNLLRELAGRLRDADAQLRH